MDTYIGSFSEEVEEGDLREMLGIFGRVRSTTMVRDGITKKPKGFGAIEMPNPDEAGRAMAGLNGRMLRGQEVVVSKSHPHVQHEPGKGSLVVRGLPFVGDGYGQQNRGGTTRRGLQ